MIGIKDAITEPTFVLAQKFEELAANSFSIIELASSVHSTWSSII
jgi:hypothetical protein